MIWLEILVLAVLQGITEFLPVSSSGHIVVASAVFDAAGQPIGEKLTVNIVLHMGTLLAILLFYRRRILGLMAADRRVIGLLVVGSIPAAAAGIVVKGTSLGGLIEEPVLNNALVAGAMFPVTGLMLLWSARYGAGERACRELGYGGALVIGLFQALAILPGVSRSGATIVAGLGCRLRRDEAAAFSFLLAVPAIGGAGLLETIELLRQPSETIPLGALAAGAAVSFLVGLAALWWLVRWLREGRLHYFAWWVIPLGVVVVAWQLIGRFG